MSLLLRLNISKNEGSLLLTTENLIDWDVLLSKIVHQSGDPISMETVLDKSDAANNNSELLKSYLTIADTWKSAGYNLKNVKWFDYYPGEHFDKSVETKFEKLVNAKARRVWISEIMPGMTAPYHWDVEDHEDTWLAEGDLVRYTCFIEKPTDGHIFVLDDQHFYNATQHSIIKWNHYKQYHAGANCGFTPFYLFHFLGTPL
jgi:hypothetical protein